MMLGTVSSFGNGQGVRVTVDGEDTATQKPYYWLSPYRPSVGDRVLIEEVGGQYVILGKVTNDTQASALAGVRPYSGGSLIDFTVFNGNLWVRQDGTQWALAKG